MYFSQLIIGPHPIPHCSPPISRKFPLYPIALQYNHLYPNGAVSGMRSVTTFEAGPLRIFPWIFPDSRLAHLMNAYKPRSTSPSSMVFYNKINNLSPICDRTSIECIPYHKCYRPFRPPGPMEGVYDTRLNFLVGNCRTSYVPTYLGPWAPARALGRCYLPLEEAMGLRTVKSIPWDADRHLRPRGRQLVRRFRDLIDGSSTSLTQHCGH